MKKGKVHFDAKVWSRSAYSLCGRSNCNRLDTLVVTHNWKKVTCVRCLKGRKSYENDLKVLGI